jgi:hypothetical protein
MNSRACALGWHTAINAVEENAVTVAADLNFAEPLWCGEGHDIFIIVCSRGDRFFNRANSPALGAEKIHSPTPLLE